jgi:isopenicillin-N N-acyltransferase like protein
MRRAVASAVVVFLLIAQNVPAAELRVVELSGSAYERGLTHGRELRAEIRELVGRWTNDLAATIAPDPEGVIRALLRDTDYLTAIRQAAPELLEEVRGIAEGAELTFETVFAFQLADEVWVNAPRLRQEGKRDKCSSLGAGAAGTNAAWVAQNVDLENFRNGFQTVLHIRGSAAEPEQYIFTFAGYLGANGLNRHGVGLCVNALIPLAHAREGLPVAFVVRKTLAQRSGRAAAEFLQRANHATGQNYILGSPEGVEDFECSANKVVRFAPLAGVVYHTNHPLANDNYDAEYLARLKRIDPEEKALESTRRRLAALEARLQHQTNGLSFATIAGALRSRDSERYPVCVPLRPGSSGFTFGSTIMRLSPEPELHVSCGPPDRNPYRAFRFAKHTGK